MKLHFQILERRLREAEALARSSGEIWDTCTLGNTYPKKFFIVSSKLTFNRMPCILGGRG